MEPAEPEGWLCSVCNRQNTTYARRCKVCTAERKYDSSKLDTISLSIKKVAEAPLSEAATAGGAPPETSLTISLNDHRQKEDSTSAAAAAPLGATEATLAEFGPLSDHVLAPLPPWAPPWASSHGFLGGDKDKPNAGDAKKARPDKAAPGSSRRPLQPSGDGSSHSTRPRVD